MAHVATITIDNTKVSADLTDYIVYVDLSGLPALFWSTVANGGGDIRVYKDDDTTELAREIVYCNTATDTGEMHIKFSGTLSSSVDTDIHIYADGTSSEPAVSDTYGRNNVWSAYEAVYHMQEDPTGTVIDSTGNYPASSGGSMTSGDLVTGQLSGYSLDFDGTDDYLDMADAGASLPSTGDYSTTFWFNNDAVASTAAFLGSYDEVTGGSNAHQAYTASSKPTDYYRSKNTDDAYEYRSTSSTISNTTWYYLATTWTASSELISLYLDGSSNQGTSTGSLNVNDVSNSLNTYIGARNYDGGGADINFNGRLDEFRLRKSVLTSSWVATEHNNQDSVSTFYSVSLVPSATDVKNDATLSTSLVSYWELEETSGTRADSHGSNDFDTLEGAPTSGAGMHGKAVSFSGSAQGLETSSGTFTMTNAASFSIAGWFKPNSAATSATLFARWAGTSKGFLVRQTAADVVEAYVGDGSTTRSVITGTTDIDDGNWHHVAFVWDHTDDKHRIYVDGVLEATAASAQTISQSTANIEIGDDTQAGSGADYTGLVDGVGAWNKALSAQEVVDLYNNGGGIPYDAATDIKNDATLSASLTSVWEMQDSANATRIDSHSTNDLDVANTVGTASGVNATVGSTAADFVRTSSEYLEIADSADMSPTGDFSIAFWINADSWPTTNGVNHGLFEKLVGTGNQRSFHFAACYGVGTTDTPEWRFLNSDNGTNIFTAYVTRTATSASTWYHIAFAYDASAGQIEVYVNGVSEGTATGLYTSIYDSTSAFTVGACKNSLASYHDGAMQQVCYWKGKVLTPTEIVELYNGGTGIPYEAASPAATSNALALCNF